MAGVNRIVVDFDGTIWNNHTNAPMTGVGEAFQELRARGIKILVYSCNQPAYIRQQLLDHGIVVDGIWEGTGKPAANAYVDDKGYRFDGDWEQTTHDLLALIREQARG